MALAPSVPFLTPAQFAERYHVPESTVRHKCQTGEIKTVKWGRKHMIPLSAASAFMGETLPQHEETDVERELRRENEVLRYELRRLRDDIDRILGPS